MLDIFTKFKTIIKRKEVSVDGFVFRLNYMLTTIVLIAFSIIITAKQYVGDPIDCIQSDKDAVSYIDSYCWIHSTYSLPSAFHEKVGVFGVPYPGIGNSRHPQEEKVYYAYYQWVCFFLFFQAMLFYIPKLLWKTWEGGLIRKLTSGLHVALSSEKDTSEYKTLLDYLHAHFRNHGMYAYKYLLCEVLCLVNIVGQMFLVDRFLGFEFFTYGLKVIEFSEQDQFTRTDPMIYIFPRMTKCHFHKIGPGGGIQRHDAFCILPVNIVNEKLYIFLWFWFILLTILTAMVVLYRVVLIAVPNMRPRILHAKNRDLNINVVQTVLRKANYGDWFLFYMLLDNVDPIIFRQVVLDVANKIETNESNNY